LLPTVDELNGTTITGAAPHQVLIQF
jgi:hypothetical protein